MACLLINSDCLESGVAIAETLKVKLSERLQKPCVVVKDPFCSSEGSLCAYRELASPFTPAERKTELLFAFRNTQLKETILPALKDGNIVLQVDGFLGDARFLSEAKLPFQELLQMNLNVFHANKCFELAAPIGSVFSGSLFRDPVAWATYRCQTGRVINFIPDFQVFPYLNSHNLDAELCSHLKQH